MRFTMTEGQRILDHFNGGVLRKARNQFNGHIMTAVGVKKIEVDTIDKFGTTYLLILTLYDGYTFLDSAWSVTCGKGNRPYMWIMIR